MVADPVPVPVPGARGVEGSLSLPEGADRDALDACVVACPPHPEYGGRRTDRRLVAVADALRERGVATLRFDYGPWDEGHGEREDARNALRWAADHAAGVGVFGYSFGGGVAALAAADVDVGVHACSLLAPHADVGPGLDVPAAVRTLSCPLQVVVGERDDTADWEPVLEAARARGATVATLAADHHLVGQEEAVGRAVAPFLARSLA